MNTVETKYAKSGDTHIAYQVVGEGDFDVVYVPGWVSHVELCWEYPELSRFLSRIASFARLIIFDKRGTGLSDRVSNDQLPTLEERADDLGTSFKVLEGGRFRHNPTLCHHPAPLKTRSSDMTIQVVPSAQSSAPASRLMQLLPERMS